MTKGQLWPTSSGSRLASYPGPSHPPGWEGPGYEASSRSEGGEREVWRKSVAFVATIRPSLCLRSLFLTSTSVRFVNRRRWQRGRKWPSWIRELSTTRQNLQISPVKFSPLDMTGEIGENLPLAKISRYTVSPNCQPITGPLALSRVPE